MSVILLLDNGSIRAELSTVFLSLFNVDKS